MIRLTTIQIICCLLCPLFSGALMADPSLYMLQHQEKSERQTISSQKNTLAELSYTPSVNQKDTLQKEGQHAGSESDKSEQLWKADFYKYGYPVESNTLSIEVELFLDHELLFAGEVRPEVINDKLKKYKTRHEGHKTLELLILNREFDSWLVLLDNEPAHHQSEEVSLVFFPGQEQHYKVVLAEAMGEIRDHHVYYLAISDWNSNIREILEIMDTLLFDSEDPYLIYFHGPSNNPIILDHNSSEDEISNFRSMVTRTTHPPGNASDELRNVMDALNDFIESSDYVPKLKLNLFFSENTHGLLQNGFTNPLLNHRLENMDLRDLQVLFITDFDVPKKNASYRYENLSKP